MMGFGQSSTVIFICIIEQIEITGKDKSGKLGYSSIIGHSAFNLLVGSAVSIMVVSKHKNQSDANKLKNVGVFTISFLTGLATYIWVYIEVQIISKNVIEVWESIFTIVLFFIFVIFAYTFDKFIAKRKSTRTIIDSHSISNASEQVKQSSISQSENEKGQVKILRYSVMEFYKVLLDEKKGIPIRNYDDQRKRKEMKDFLFKYIGNDNILEIQYQQLKRLIEGDIVIDRIQYKLQFGRMIQARIKITKEVGSIKKGQIKQNKISENQDFGFKSLQYSVSESSGFAQITVINKKKEQGIVAFRTIDGTAKQIEDFEKVNQVIKFKNRQQEVVVKIKIMDDDDYEPDEEFYCELYNPRTGYQLPGKDTRCTVIIIDDDKPGMICFEKTQVKVLSNEPYAIVNVIRQNGCKGKISCKYKTIEAEHFEQQAVPDEEFQDTEGTIEFQNQETQKEVKIKILPKERIEENIRVVFGLKIFDPQPEGQVKISMKDICYIEIVNDNESHIKNLRLDQYLINIDRIENRSWSQQFKQACILHPTKYNDSQIIDITNLQALIHLITIGWKIIVSLIPPPQKGKGWPAFFISLIFVGVTCKFLIEFSNLLGCETGISQDKMGIIFISIFISIPDLYTNFMSARYLSADSALFTHLCSVSCGGTFGFGFSWLIGSMYHNYKIRVKRFYLDEVGLKRQILIFIFMMIFYFLILMIRRKFAKGELGGNQIFKYISSGLLIILWIIFVVLTTVISPEQFLNFN